MKQEPQDNLTGLPPVTEPLRLYMPLRAELYERDEYGYLESDAVWLDGQALAGYADSIRAALLKNCLPEETERGLMRWYHEADTVNDKVASIFFTAEVREGQLWGVAACQLTAPLTPEDLAILCEYISGQASDGWGEDFEQHEIPIGDSELYVHLWNSDNWSILAEKERFDPTFAQKLPEMCWSVSPTDGSLVTLKKGVAGYQPCKWDTEDATINRRLAGYYNERMGISRAQEQAMVGGALFGWDDPRADPRKYTQDQTEHQPNALTGQDARGEISGVSDGHSMAVGMDEISLS